MLLCCFKKKKQNEIVGSDGANTKSNLNLNDADIIQGPSQNDIEEERGGSMQYQPTGYKHESFATFGAGCYWGTEKWFVEFFNQQSRGALLGYAVGFMSHETDAPENPTYRQVCSGETGHVEVFHIRYDSQKVKYEDLVKYFFTFHDPTTRNQQGNDQGTQYASIIYFHHPDHEKIAKKVIEQVQQKMSKGKINNYKRDKVETQVHKAREFYPAHYEHQEYLMKKPNGYCNHRKRFDWAKL